MMQYSQKQMTSMFVMWFSLTANALLALRVVLRFFNGNPDATFVHWVYTNTQILLEPFRNVFVSSGVVDRGWVIDYVAILAMAAYAVVGYLFGAWVMRTKEK